MNELPLIDIIRQSYRSVASNAALLVRAAGLWIALAVILGGLMMASLGHQPVTTLDPTNLPITFAFLSMIDSLTALLGVTAILVFWHRFTLLEESSVGFAAPVTRNVLHYAWISFLIGLMAVPVALALTFIFVLHPQSIGIILIALTLTVTWLTARFSILLPAIAIDVRHLTFRSSWKMTAGYSSRIFAGVVATILPFYALGFVLGEIIAAIGASFTLLAVLIKSILLYIQAAVFAGFLSRVYQCLATASQPGDGQAE